MVMEDDKSYNRLSEIWGAGMLPAHPGLGLKDLGPRTLRMLLSGQDQRPENLAGPIASRTSDPGVLSVEEHAQLQENEAIFPLSLFSWK